MMAEFQAERVRLQEQQERQRTREHSHMQEAVPISDDTHCEAVDDTGRSQSLELSSLLRTTELRQQLQAVVEDGQKLENLRQDSWRIAGYWIHPELTGAKLLGYDTREKERTEVVSHPEEVAVQEVFQSLPSFPTLKLKASSSRGSDAPSSPPATRLNGSGSQMLAAWEATKMPPLIPTTAGRISELAANMCGEQPEQVLVIEKAKMALVSFQHTAEQDALDHDDVLLWDVPSSIHRLHMFGSGRYRFFVERSDKEPVELFKPIHPFMLQWDVLTHPGGSVNNKKKPPTVKGMCDWRNPLGFACHVDETLPPTEFVGCCASVQGLEGGAQAFVAGSTVLPLRFLPLLLTTLCPERWALNWAVWGVRILHHELVNLPAKTLAPEVLEAINFLRVQLQEALYPASWWDEWNEPWNESGARHARGPKDRDDLVETPDLSESLQITDSRRSGTMIHSDLYNHFQRARMDLRRLAEFKNVIEYLTAHGECLVKDLPKSMQKNKTQFGKRPDLFELQQTKKGSLLVRLAGAPATKKNGNQGQRGSARAHGREKPLVDAIIRLLKGRKEGGPMGLGELGSQDESRYASVRKNPFWLRDCEEHVKDLLTQQKVQLQKIKPFLQAFPSVFEMGEALCSVSHGLCQSHWQRRPRTAWRSASPEDGHGQLAVQLCGGGFDFKSVPKSRSTKGAHPGSGRRKGGSLVTEHITSLCSQSPALAADFDGRVKGLLQDIQEKEGADGLDECFDMLHEWLSKKEERSSINNWTAYIMKLLRNWNQME
eukprot:g6942.t1